MLGKPKRGRITIGDLEKIIPELLEMPVEQRRLELGMRPDRADVIAIAAQVLHFIADEANIARITVPGIGLKDGVLRQLARQHNLATSATRTSTPPGVPERYRLAERP
jgi:exopolyphosphatase/guanosine-5'-triphosphate,3'-diphosphate pyrophosphatase